MQQLIRRFALPVILAYIAIHGFILASLIVQGLRLDPAHLSPLGVAWYAGLILLSLVLVLRGRRDEDGSVPLVVVPLLAVAASVVPFDGTGGGHIARWEWSDRHLIFILLAIMAGLSMSVVSLAYRRPRLLLLWAAAFGLAMVTYPRWWMLLWQYGYFGAEAGLTSLAMAMPLVYLATARALGLRLQPGWPRPLLAGLLAGVALAAFGGWRYLEYGSAQIRPLDMGRWLAEAMLSIILFGVLVLPLPLLAWRRLKATAGVESRRFPWEALALALWIAGSLLPELQRWPAGATAPRPLWIPGLVAPESWLAVVDLTDFLRLAAPWLALPYACVGLASLLVDLRRRDRPRPALPGFPDVLLLAGAGWLGGIFAPLLPAFTFPISILPDRDDGSVWAGFWLPLLGAVGLLVAGRAWENRMDARLSPLWRAVSLGALALLILWAGRLAWDYARVFAMPWPAWLYYPGANMVPPEVRATLNLILYTVLFVVGLLALARTLSSILRRPARTSQIVLGLGLPLALVLGAGALGWWITEPQVVRVMPAPGAREVPLDARISAEVGPSRGRLDQLLGSGSAGMRVSYADGSAVAGFSSGGSSPEISGAALYSFQPDPPLRPNSEIIVMVVRSGERNFTMRFTTGGAGGPPATPDPLPDWFPTPAAPPARAE